MEGRVPPAGNEGQKGDPSSSLSLMLSLPIPSGMPTETYVIQIPRDQVYRVPPPENVKIVESYRGMQSKKKDTRFRKCCCWFLTPLVILGIAIGTIVGTINALYVPKSPEFSIAQVHFKNSSEPAQHHKDRRHRPPPPHPTFEISLQVENFNERMKVSFGDEGKSSLVLKNHIIATGKYPSISLEPRGRTDVELNVNVTKLSGDLQKGLNDRKTKSMTLKVSVPMEISSWAQKKKKDITVTCVFKVDSLTKSTKVLSEECRTNF